MSIKVFFYSWGKIKVFFVFYEGEVRIIIGPSVSSVFCHSFYSSRVLLSKMYHTVLRSPPQIYWPALLNHPLMSDSCHVVKLYSRNEELSWCFTHHPTQRRPLIINLGQHYKVSPSVKILQYTEKSLSGRHLIKANWMEGLALEKLNRLA